MKIKYITILSVIILSLIQCNKRDKDISFSNESIVIDNAVAAMYFHIIFREAENAWAIIDDLDYVSDTYTDPKSTSTSYKKLTYEEKEVTIEYHSWITNNYLLFGTVTVRFDKDVYRTVGKVANIYLKGFSINGQNVVGESTLRYGKEKDNDIYTYSLLEGSAIHELGSSKPVLISGSIRNGRYERIEGNETLEQDDDVWTFSGVMTGMLRETPSMKYTNTVLTTYYLGDEEMDGTVYYSMNCKFARQGASEIKISERSNIFYLYLCSEDLFFSSSTDIH